jgi:hypothetical protein
MLEIILLILALIAIVGACIYFYTDMKDHKAANNTDFEKVNKNIEEEETTRLGNIKYVVDQVNTTNTAMDTEYKNKFNMLEDTGTGFGKLIVAQDASGSNIEFKDVTDTSKIKLMRDVSVIGSMSIKELEIANRTTNSNKPSFKACGIGIGSSSAPCIEFPNSEGDTYLTGIVQGKSVVSGSMFKANAGLMTDKMNNLTNHLTISTGELGNEIVVGKTKTDGIKLTSGASTITIKDGVIDINTGSIDDASLSNIKLNNKAIAVVPTEEDPATALKNKKVLTLSA